MNQIVITITYFAIGLIPAVAVARHGVGTGGIVHDDMTLSLAAIIWLVGPAIVFVLAMENCLIILATMTHKIQMRTDDDEVSESGTDGRRSKNEESIFLREENPVVYGVDESEALVRTPERSAFWGRAGIRQPLNRPLFDANTDI